jgi:hypothetical protein
MPLLLGDALICSQRVFLSDCIDVIINSFRIPPPPNWWGWVTLLGRRQYHCLSFNRRDQEKEKNSWESLELMEMSLYI